MVARHWRRSRRGQHRGGDRKTARGCGIRHPSMGATPGFRSLLPHDIDKNPGRTGSGDEGHGGHGPSSAHRRCRVQDKPYDGYKTGIDENRTWTEASGYGTHSSTGYQPRRVEREHPLRVRGEEGPTG